MRLFSTYQAQLETWVAGYPEHHGTRGEKVSRCVPDFSCCRPEMLSAPEVRLAYAKACPEDRKRMCEGFMRLAITSTVGIPSIGVEH